MSGMLQPRTYDPDESDAEAHLPQDVRIGARSARFHSLKQVATNNKVRIYRTDDTYQVQELPVASAYRWLTQPHPTRKRLWVEESELLGNQPPNYRTALADLDIELSTGLDAMHPDPNAKMLPQPLTQGQVQSYLARLEASGNVRRYKQFGLMDTMPGEAISYENGNVFPEFDDPGLDTPGEANGETNEKMDALTDSVGKLADVLSKTIDKIDQIEARLNNG